MKKREEYKILQIQNFPQINTLEIHEELSNEVRQAGNVILTSMRLLEEIAHDFNPCTKSIGVQVTSGDWRLFAIYNFPTHFSKRIKRSPSIKFL